MNLPVHTRIGVENREGGLLLCGVNHGYSKQDEEQDAAGIDRSDPHKSFFSDAKVNNYRFRNRLVTWFELWGYPLERHAASAGTFERSIVQTNWLQSCSRDVRDISVRQACIEDHRSFLQTCSALRPRIVVFLGVELLEAFMSSELENSIETLFGQPQGDCRWLQKHVLRNGVARRRLRVGFREYDRLAVAAFPHPTGTVGLADDYVAAFREEMQKMIDPWWKSHRAGLAENGVEGEQISG